MIWLSGIPVPSIRNGSWPRMLEYYLTHQDDPVTIVCPQSTDGRPDRYPHARCLPRPLVGNRWVRRLLCRPQHFHLVRTAAELVAQSPAVIGVFDHVQLLRGIHAELKRRQLRHRARILFFNHGFSYLFSPSDALSFYAAVDETVFLTRLSYQFEMSRVHAMPCHASVLHDGVDVKRFTTATATEKAARQHDFGLPPGQTVYLWTSADRPKKGLDFLLAWWPEFAATHPDAWLLVAGAQRPRPCVRTVFLGAVPHDELHRVHQAADIFLLPTLCQEGFSLALGEAMAAGCACVASALGGVPEVLANGQGGLLIQTPHDPAEWMAAMDKLHRDQPYRRQVAEAGHRLATEHYSMEEWCRGMRNRFQYWEPRLDR